MRTSLHALLVLILMLALASCAPRGNARNGNGGDDDDDTVADDDDTVANDDDSVADDDDDSTPTGDDDDDVATCDDTFFYNEQDDLDNFSQKTAEVALTSGADYGMIEIGGTVASCGGGEGYGDMDWFQIDIACARTTQLDLVWSGGSDLDVFLVDDEGTELIAGINEGSSLESGTVTVQSPGTYWVAVGCWDGTATSYEAFLDYR